MRKTINFTAIILICIGLYNLFSLKGFLPAVRHVNTELCLLYFDIALALTAGLVIYILTSALPFYLMQNNYRNIYKENFNKFYKNTKNRLDKIDTVDFSKTKKEVKALMEELKYSDKPNKGARDTIYVILNKIVKDKEALYRDCLPYVNSAEDTKILNKIHELINNPLFNELDREYLQKNIDDLGKIGIGGIIKDFYDELVKLESTLT